MPAHWDKNLTAQATGTLTPRQVLHRPKPRNRGSGLPSPVLKLAWHRMQTYIFELDIIGLTPGSAFGRAAVYSAWVWRSLGPAVVSVGGGVRRVVMADKSRVAMPGSSRSAYCPRNVTLWHSGQTRMRGALIEPAGRADRCCSQLRPVKSGTCTAQAIPRGAFSRHSTRPPSSLTRLRTPPKPKPWAQA